MSRTATAPYNFVSLPMQVLPSPIDGGAKTDEMRQENYRNHVLTAGKYSGSLNLSIKTMTEIFVGNGGSEFFSPNGMPVIPGSTIRGMVKNIFKIVTCGAMRGNKEDADFNDKHLYFRTMADKNGNIRKTYSSRIKKDYVEAGFLVHSKDDNQYYMLNTDFEEKNGNASDVEAKSPGIEWGKNGEGVTTYTGPMKRKHHYTIHSIPNWDEITLDEQNVVDESVIDDYKKDETRKGVDIFSPPYCLKSDKASAYTGNPDLDFVAPCFYVKENGKISHFGYGRFYRIPYRNSIGKAIPEELQTDIVDYADALFGRKELWGSRLSFEDAHCAKGKADQDKQAAYAQILSSPKPTSFQLYLKQDDSGNIRHWESKGASIRGYKMYWHKKTSWRNPEQEATEMCPHPIHPVKQGQVFHSKIRFERLSKDEVGALLKVFELSQQDKTLCFKIGQGKSIGLGSVRVEASLQLDDESYYRQLFNESGQWQNDEKSEDFSQYIEDFDKKLKSGLSKEAYFSYQISQRELSHLLDWKNTELPEWNEKTRAMDIEDADKPFQNRFILPTAIEVK